MGEKGHAGGLRKDDKVIADYLAMLRRFNRNVRLYLLSGVLIGFTTVGGIYNVLLNLYVLRLGYGLEFIGLVSATGALSFAVFCLPAGTMGRRWGIRHMMIAGMSLIVVGNALLPLVEFVSAAWQAEFLLATRLPRAMGFALYIVNANPFLMSATSPEERTHVFSVQAALWPLAGFAGGVVGGFLPGLFANILGLSLDDPEPYRHTLFVAAALLSPAVWVLLSTREVGTRQSQEGSADEAGPAPRGPIFFIALVVLFQTAGVAGIQSFFNVYLDEGLRVSTALIGTLIAAGQLVGGVAALSTPLISMRLGHRRLIQWGSLGAILVFLPLIFIAQWGVAGLAYVALSALASIRFAAFVVYQQEMVPARWRSIMSGAASMASGLSFSSVALVGGYMIPALGYDSLFLLCAGLTGVGTLVFWGYFRVPRGEYARRGTVEPAT